MQTKRIAKTFFLLLLLLLIFCCALKVKNPSFWYTVYGISFIFLATFYLIFRLYKRRKPRADRDKYLESQWYQHEARLQKIELWIARSMPDKGKEVLPASVPQAESSVFTNEDEEIPQGEKNMRRPGNYIIPPREMLLRFIQDAQASPYIRLKPQIPKGRWNLGCASIKGNVRATNQDYSLCFEIEDIQVLLIADGCGGFPYGDVASYLACRNAAKSIIQTYGSGIPELQENPALVAAIAMRDAYQNMAQEARKFNLRAPQDGCCTTLIILIGTPEQYACAHIGDGGGIILSESQSIPFLQPQKASKEASNFLAACLGPVMVGGPIIKTIPRKPGEIAMIGTDGVFDFVEDDFFPRVFQGCHSYQGDFQRVSYQVLKDLSMIQEEGGGYFHDDNMTLGLMGDKERGKNAGRQEEIVSKVEEERP